MAEGEDISLKTKEVGNDENVFKNEYKATCPFCTKLILKSNLKRHTVAYCTNTQTPTPSYECENCHKSFKRSDHLKIHHEKCKSSKSAKKKTLLSCNYEECSKQFYTLVSLIEHLKSVHDAPVQDELKINFKNEKQFIDWKEAEEARTFSFYSKKCGDRICNDATTKYFYCQQHGSEKPHRSNLEGNKKTDRRVVHGRTKTGDICISSIKATYFQDGSIVVVHKPTHSHPLNPSNLQYHPLSSESYKYIDTQIASGVSPLIIQRELKKRTVEMAEILQLENKELYKDCYVSLKLIRERARRRQNSSMFHPDDAKSLMLLTQHLLKEDPDLILVYKPLGIPCYIGPQEINNLPDSNNVFMYGFQTKEQRELMLSGSKVILVADETHCTNQYGFSLLNLLVVDDNKHGWPVGHFISNRNDEQSLQFFFKAMKLKILDLEIQ